MKKSSTLIFFGNERLSTGFRPNGAPTLQKLINAGYRVAAVVAHHESATSRQARQLEVELVARAHHIPILLPDRPAQIKEQLASYQPTIGVLAAYGKIIPSSIISLFEHGILNIHPSLLPLYRGPTPIERAILDGATTTGISIMQLTKEMDAGPIYAQKQTALKDNETKQSLTERLLNLGGDLLMKVLPKVLGGTLTPTAQKGSATYTSLINKQDGQIDWHKPALQIEREIRAFTVWPQSTGKIILPNNRSIEILPAYARLSRTALALEEGKAAYNNKQLLVGTGTTPIEIVSLKLPGRKTITAEQFVNGYLKR